MAKTAIEIEKLLQWAYLDELSKRQLSASEAVWERIGESAAQGGVAISRSAPQRYAFVGSPHPDAIRIEGEVNQLSDVVIDWNANRAELLGPLDFMFDAFVDWRRSDVKEERGRKYYARLCVEGDPFASRPALRPRAIVMRCAVLRNRPDYEPDGPQLLSLKAANDGGRSVVFHVGEGGRYTLGKSTGTYSRGDRCALMWFPSPGAVAYARGEYAAWHAGLCRLTDSLNSGGGMQDHVALPPIAPSAPWLTGEPAPSRILQASPIYQAKEAKPKRVRRTKSQAA